MSKQDLTLNQVTVGDIGGCVTIKGKNGEPALTFSHDGVEVGPGWVGAEHIVEQLRSAFMAPLNTYPHENELSYSCGTSKNQACCSTSTGIDGHD